MPETQTLQSLRRAAREPSGEAKTPAHPISKLVTGIAHEVRNPLGVLLMGTDCLANKLQGDELALRVLEDMRNAIARLDAIVSALPDVSPAHRRTPQAEDVNQVVESSLRRVAPEAAAKGITVVREYDAELPPILLDAKKCQQAVVHLLNNAIEAMPQGGTLTLQTLRDETAAPGGDAVALLICDTGCGVPPHLLGRVFEPFFSAAKHERNAGLGLTVAREIIHAHGGTITIGNCAAGGALVSVTLAGSRGHAEGNEREAK